MPFTYEKVIWTALPARAIFKLDDGTDSLWIKGTEGSGITGFGVLGPGAGDRIPDGAINNASMVIPVDAKIAL